MSKAISHLQASDPILADVIRRVGPFRLRPDKKGTHFHAVARAIIYQQLSGKAAGTIHRRFLDIYGGRAPGPRKILETTDQTLRGAGLSRQKLGYLQDLARCVETGQVPMSSLGRLDDETVIAALTRVKGVGRWTAQMFLIFRLGRENVLPDTDLGIQKAVQKAYGLRRMPTPPEVQRRGAPWQPFCSVAAWYLWRSLEG